MVADFLYKIIMTLSMSDQRLRWACRRGMLELDLLLEPYVLECYEQASPAEQRKFVKLLACADQDLFDWFLKKKLPEDPENQEMVEIILKHAHAKI